MRVLVIGADGFIGKKVREVLSTTHDVYLATRSASKGPNHYSIDLEDKTAIGKLLSDVRPEVIINCAGVVDASGQVELNAVFTKNILDAAKHSGLIFKKIIISGSAAEYGTVDATNIPVDEDVPLAAQSAYGMSKLEETRIALEYREKHSLPVVVARIFNPIGVGMQPKFLVSRIIGQVEEIKRGERRVIEVSRLDAQRDYINVKDVALAIKALVEGEPKGAVYNIGSGISTSNQELIELILDYCKLPIRPQIDQTSLEKESLVASQADISRITHELGWRPSYTIEQTIKEIINASF